jgi:hypothetical protein
LRLAKTSDGARASARFTVHNDKLLEITIPLSFRTLKRCERAPHPVPVRYHFTELKKTVEDAK